MRKQLLYRWGVAFWLLALSFPYAGAQIPDTGIVHFPHWTLDPSLLDLTRLPRRPDTLLIGEYVIAVERYDSLGTFHRASQTFSGVSGIGRILFPAGRRWCFRPLHRPTFLSAGLTCRWRLFSFR
ncbi:MAG: hypothetical protein IPM81_01150 [Saprospirales bacterium]|nr:hypothetical protein [Saprospirales bacterium]